MRFMMLLKSTEATEAGVLPSQEVIAAMARYNEELIEAGVLLDGEGLRPSSEGARVTFADGGVMVTDGPFTETKELIAGYWQIQVRSKEEAIEWAKRIPVGAGGSEGDSGAAEVELRRIFEPDDFGEALTPELREQEERLRERTAERR